MARSSARGGVKAEAPRGEVPDWSKPMQLSSTHGVFAVQAAAFLCLFLAYSLLKRAVRAVQQHKHVLRVSSVLSRNRVRDLGKLETVIDP